MASDHRGNPLHAGKRTRDEYPRLTRALARMNRRDFVRSDFGGSYPPNPSAAMAVGEGQIELYKDANQYPETREYMGKLIGKAFTERGLPDGKALGDLKSDVFDIRR